MRRLKISLGLGIVLALVGIAGWRVVSGHRSLDGAAGARGRDDPAPHARRSGYADRGAVRGAGERQSSASSDPSAIAATPIRPADQDEDEDVTMPKDIHTPMRAAYERFMARARLDAEKRRRFDQ